MIASINVIMRGLALVAKFALLLYLSRYVGLEAVGIYGLIQSAAVLGSRFLGWGLYFEANRALVGETPDKQVDIIIAPQWVYMGGYAVFVLILAFSWSHWPASWHVVLPYIVPLMLLNHQIVELTQVLLAKQQTFPANLAIFLNSGWAYAAAAAGLMSPEWRTLDVTLNCWLAGATMAVLVCLFALRKLPFSFAALFRPRLGWLAQAFIISAPLYLAMVGQLVNLLGDRYVLGFALSAREVGIYVMFWSFGNAVQVLVQTGLLQLSQPQLIALYKNNHYAAFKLQLRKITYHVVLVSSVYMVLAVVLIEPVLRLVGQTEAIAFVSLFYLLLLSFFLRLVAEVCQQALYALRADRALITTNLSAAVVMIVAACTGAITGQLLGAGWAVVMAAAYLFASQYYSLRLAIKTWREKNYPYNAASA